MGLQYNGEEHIPAPIDKVWAFVTDPEKVGHCFPEVTNVRVHDTTHFDAEVRVGVGPVRGKFTLKVELQPDPVKHHLGMTVSGGGFGSAVDMTANADIAQASPAETTLTWSGRADVRGPVAAVGGRVLDAQAQKLIARSFATVRERLTSTA
jgi:carbon monoxide dehydrogenase subunit G